MERQLTTLNSLGDIANLLDSLVNNPDFSAPELESIKLGGDLEKFKLYFKGENYDHSLSSGCIKGLWEYQQSLYRGVAELLYGSSHITVLTKEDLKNFELVFKISDGSIELSALLTQFFDSLAEGFTTMESRHKLITIILSILIVSGSYTAISIVDSTQATQQAEISVKHDTATEEEKTKQFELITSLVSDYKKVGELNNHIAEGHRSIVKGASDAEEIHIGKMKFDRDQIIEINQRSSRTEAEVKIYNEQVKITKIEPQEGITRIAFSRTNGEELVSLIDDDNFEKDDLESIWKAAKTRSLVSLQFSVTRAGKNIRGTQIIGLSINETKESEDQARLSDSATDY